MTANAAAATSASSGSSPSRNAGSPLVVDLLWHLPAGVIDRRNAPDVAQARGGEVATLTVNVEEKLFQNRYRVDANSDRGTVQVRNLTLDTGIR